MWNDSNNNTSEPNPNNEEEGGMNTFDVNPYESFMRKHLQHYGYFTGRNKGYRRNSHDGWLKTPSSDSESVSDSESDENQDGGDEYFRTTQLVYNLQAGRMVPRLREPRQLYALTTDLGPQQAARWPAEMQVIKGRVKHVDYTPPGREPFYTSTHNERTPWIRTEENGGRCVFHYQPIAGPYFIRSRVGGHRIGCTKATVDLESEDDQTLIFESRFESGNLMKAVEVGMNEYELWLRTDMYTKKHTQWFYFRVGNTRSGVTYRFTIVNLSKTDSLYNHGMVPLMYSERAVHELNVGWTRRGSDIKYYKNNLRYSTAKGERNYYSLTWTFTAPYDDDTIYFAHATPYTYTDLQDYLLELMNDPVKLKICKQRVLCRTLAGNLVYVLTITSPSRNVQASKHKKAVVITARVHPGETQASWMMKGFLDYLTGNSADAKLLRDLFMFKIVPMLNPDGVIVGNYRCSLTGCDLNRNYKTQLKETFPSVWYTRNMIRRLSEEREVLLYCDLHGHSRKQNVFIYGCENRLDADRRLHERILPSMLHKNAPDKFRFEYCKFKVQKSKEGTGRVVVWNMGIMNSFTLEATFAGSVFGALDGFHFNVGDFEALSYHFCDTLLDYTDPDHSKYVNVFIELETRLRQNIAVRLERRGGHEISVDDVHLSDDYGTEIDSSDSGGSDSSVSDSLPVHFEYVSDRARKKKKLKSRKERDKNRIQKDSNTLSAAQRCHPVKPRCLKPPPVKRVSTQQTATRTANNDDEQTEPTYVVVGNHTTHKPTANNQQKQPPSLQKVYLEALTDVLLHSGMMTTSSPSNVPHFRYSLASKASSVFPVNQSTLCPHHAEQSLAAQFVSQLQQLDTEDQPQNESDHRLHNNVAYSVTIDSENTSVGPVRYRMIAANRKTDKNRGVSGMIVQPSKRHLLELAVAGQNQERARFLARDKSRTTGVSDVQRHRDTSHDLELSVKNDGSLLEEHRINREALSVGLQSEPVTAGNPREDGRTDPGLLAGQTHSDQTECGRMGGEESEDTFESDAARPSYSDENINNND